MRQRQHLEIAILSILAGIITAAPNGRKLSARPFRFMARGTAEAITAHEEPFEAFRSSIVRTTGWWIGATGFHQ
jgi:hypothetical protein